MFFYVYVIFDWFFSQNAQDMVKQLKQLQEEKNKLQKVKQDAEKELENTKSSLDSKQREVMNYVLKTSDLMRQ